MAETIDYRARVDAPKTDDKPEPAPSKSQTIDYAARPNPPTPARSALPGVALAVNPLDAATIGPNVPTARRTSLDFDATIAAEDARVSLPEASASLRSTVLPRLEGGEVVLATGKLRYERLKPLGEGGMGEVTLARDHDIDRPVAIKRLRAEHRGTGSLLRFAQEIRTIGRLEHPNIIPVHDVGIDEQGQHYFVMKYVEGDTLETIIEKLQARNPVYELRFPYEVRAQIFLGILRAVQYAHAQGIIHRDIKPANIMVGPYGEVMVMDWGLARPVRGTEIPPEFDGPVPPVNTSASTLQTQHGAIMGTPHYMSPEQARGETDKINERSDVYSLAVMFHEFISLRHYLDGKESVAEVLEAVATVADRERSIVDWIGDAVATGAPMEYLHFIRHGVAPHAADRYANAGEMAEALGDILSGKMKVQCHVTATKRAVHGGMHAVDRHPLVATVLLLAAVGMAFTGIVAVAQILLRLAHVVT